MNYLIIFGYSILLALATVLLIVHRLSMKMIKKTSNNYLSLYKSILFTNSKSLSNFIYLFYIGTIVFSSTVFVSLDINAAQINRILFLLSLIILTLSSEEIVRVEFRAYKTLKLREASSK